MVDREIIDAVNKYLDGLPAYGIHPSDAVLYGSQLRGTATEWSDIDLIVIAPEFDGSTDPFLEKKLWQALENADSRIQPIACGTKAWAMGTKRMIIELARAEGMPIRLAAAA